ncbi:MAG: hypothetical protein R2838_22910 [Caldilineaceae bacterium]
MVTLFLLGGADPAGRASAPTPPRGSVGHRAQSAGLLFRRSRTSPSTWTFMDVAIDTSAPLTATWQPDLLEGVVTIAAHGAGGRQRGRRVVPIGTQCWRPTARRSR